MESHIFMGFGKPDYGLAGYLRVGCGFFILFIAKMAHRNPQVIPKPRKVAGETAKVPARLRVTCGFERR
jgi:hypothetical protein